MRRFKEYLIESKLDFAPWHIRDKELIEKIFAEIYNGYKKEFSVLKDGSVKPKTTFASFIWPKYVANKFNLPIDKLPFKFATAKNRLTIKSQGLLDLTGTPESAKTIHLECENLKTLETVNGTYENVYINCPNLESFKCNINSPYVFFQTNVSKFDFNDFHTSCPQTKTVRFVFSKDCIFAKIPLLGFYKNNIDIDMFRNSFSVKSENKNEYDMCVKLFDLYEENFDKHVHILDFQDILIENGFGKQARIK
jgi:hypothetical protein